MAFEPKVGVVPASSGIEADLLFGRVFSHGKMRLMIFHHVTDNPCVIQLDDGRFMNAVAYPDNLVQYVARDLLRRASIITVPGAQMLV